MGHPLPYSVIGEGTKTDLISWFSGYYKNTYGYYLPYDQWGKEAGFIKYMSNKGYSLEEIGILLWGVTYEEDRVTSMWYAKYFQDKLEKYKESKERYLEQKKKQEEKQKEIDNMEVNYEGDNQEIDPKEYFAEFME